MVIKARAKAIKTLLLFWGWTNDDSSYQGIVDSAPKGWQVLNINYEDYMPGGDVSKLNANVLKFLAQKKLTKLSLMGHSVGAALALRFALSFPEKINHLYLLDSTGIPGSQNPIVVLKYWFKLDPLQKLNPQINQRSLYSRILKSPWLHLRVGFFGFYHNIETEAQKLAVPTTIIWGAKDQLIPLWKGQRLHQLVSKSRFISIDGMSHDWVKYYPQKFWAYVQK